MEKQKYYRRSTW